MARQGFSRYPVLDAGGDIAGYLHLKDVLYADDERHEAPVPRSGSAGSPHRPGGDEVEDVLATMQAHRGAPRSRHRWSGAVTGVVFLEDMLEKLVGEVTDHDALSGRPGSPVPRHVATAGPPSSSTRAARPPSPRAAPTPPARRPNTPQVDTGTWSRCVVAGWQV